MSNLASTVYQSPRALCAAALLAAVLLGACGGGTSPKKDGSGTSQSGGSCTQSDMTVPGLNVCWTTTSARSDFAAACQQFGGVWAQSSCDAALYTRRCTTKGTESVGGGKGAEVKEVHYFQPGSKFSCLEDEEL